MNFEKLFEPIKIGRVEIRNRIVMPAMSTNFSNPDGSISQRQIHYYARRANGGVGLIITEALCVESAVGKLSPIQPCIDHDKFIAGLNELVEEVKFHGSRIAAQLHHAGRRAQWIDHGQPVSASDHLLTPSGVRPRALSKEEISALVDRFSKAALRAKMAGFDAVEMHGAHGYLIAQFLSPHTNKRTDEYGGGVEGRARFALEIVERSRERIGSDFPIIFRISAEEFIEGGLTLGEAKTITKKLEDGGVDAIHVSAGAFESRHWTSAPPAIQAGYLVQYAAEIKKAVGVPVIAVGRINSPELAEKIIEEGKADLVAMGRALIAEPDLPRKAMEGDLEGMRKCIGCNRCLTRFGDMLHIKCSINPEVGREGESLIEPAKDPKKIVVVGGGPAGLEAAYIAAMRGHDVVLYERNERLGGQLLLASVPPHKEDVGTFADWLVSRVRGADVEVRTGIEATPELIIKESPDSVIIATGASPLIPNVPGVDRENVITSWDVLSGRASVGDFPIIIGGGMVGCETAEFLSAMGKRVRIVEMLDSIAIDVDFRSRMFLLERLQKLGVEVFTKTKLEGISDEGIVVSKDCGREVLKCDTVVLAVGAKPERELIDALKERVEEVYSIGDCVSPRKILEAIEEGFMIGAQV